MAALEGICEQIGPALYIVRRNPIDISVGLIKFLKRSSGVGTDSYCQLMDIVSRLFRDDPQRPLKGEFPSRRDSRGVRYPIAYGIVDDFTFFNGQEGQLDRLTKQTVELVNGLTPFTFPTHNRTESLWN